MGAWGPAQAYTRFAMKLVTGFVGLTSGSLIGLTGLLLILYQGEAGSEGDTYVNVEGQRSMVISSESLS